MRKHCDDYVSASEIARLAYCERQVAFDAMFGRRATPDQRRAQQCGLCAHEEFFREGQLLAKSGARAGRGLRARWFVSRVSLRWIKTKPILIGGAVLWLALAAALAAAIVNG